MLPAWRVCGSSSPCNFKRPEYTSRSMLRAFSRCPSSPYVIARLAWTTRILSSDVPYSRPGSENGNSREWEFPGTPGNSRGPIFHSRGARPRKAGKTRQLQWTRQTRFVLWAGSGQADAPGACLTVLRYPSTRQSHWKCLSGFGEAAPARLPPDLPDSREFPSGVGGPGSSRVFPTPEISFWELANYTKYCDKI